jgi:uncharacterized protein (TIGR04255 family)
MLKPLPITLAKEPLLEAVCELRISPAGSFHTVLPGYLFAKFPGQVSGLEQLPAASIPEVIRAQDPNLAYASVARLIWREFYVLIGPRSVAVSCRMPYPKWPSFKANVLEIFRNVIESGLVKGVDRYSVKYVNYFPSPDGKHGRTDMLDWSLRIGDFSVREETTHLRVEMPTDDMVTVVTISSPAQVAKPNEPETLGGVVDVDTVCTHVTNDLSAFSAELEERLDAIRLVNKRAFFDCLTEQAIASMEPTYDNAEQLSRSLH